MKLGSIILAGRILSVLRKAAFQVSGIDRHYFMGRKLKETAMQDWDLLSKCDSSHSEVDVIVSLYRHDDFLVTLAESINTNICPKVNFVLMFVCSDRTSVTKTLSNLALGARSQVHRIANRASIYETWNIGIANSSSPLITNLNADDLRRPGAICQMARGLDSEASFDVTYGDSLMVAGSPLESWQPRSSTQKRSHVGTFSVRDLMYSGYNKPHCAPMWRRALHEDVGPFRQELRSSGDSEFWLRCLLAGKKFLYLPFAGVAYFNNPNGLSTSSNSAGFREWNSILRKHAGALRVPKAQK
jgi:hypothetical protein